MSPVELNRAIEKLKRFGSMTVREIAFRVREKGYSELERIGLGLRDPRAPQGQGFKSYLGALPASRFYCGCDWRKPAVIEKNASHWIDRAVVEADKLCRHEVQLLNLGKIQLGPEIDWHRDPLTGQTWERRFWADYHPENDVIGRDVKIVHELNRHQHLPTLAKTYSWTGNERYAAEAVAQLNSWIDQNPPGLGINWQSSLEIGIRAISWLWTIFLLLPSKSLDDLSARRIGDSLFAQLEHVHRHTSLYTSPNTHLIGEAAALFIAGLVFQDRECAIRWLGQGARLLCQEAEKQILPDGVYAELSTYYHCYALDFYLQAFILANRNKFSLPEPVPQKVCDMLRFLMHITRPDGTLPLLGDDDGGRALALSQRNYHSFNDALCAGAVLFQRPDFKHQACAFSEEAFWLLGEEAWAAYHAVEAMPPAALQLFCPDAGYSIQRSGWGPLDSHLIFDFGGLGMLNGGHAHADALSLSLFSHGQELLTDPGTYVYNCKPEWRNYFRSTRAHNTVTIDGRDQAEPGGTFRWKTKIRSRLQRFAESGIEYLEAEHDGYTRAANGIVHRRRLIYIPSEYWIVIDDFRGSGEHTFDFNFHFGTIVAPSALEQDDRGVVMCSKELGLLGLFTSQPSTATMVQGQSSPIEGWISHGYGEKESASVLHVSFAGPTSSAAMTFLAPSMKAPIIKRLEIEAGSAIACSYEHASFRDIAILSTGDSEVRVAGFRMRGEFVWLRTEQGVVTRTLAAPGSSFSREGHENLEDAICAASVA